MEILTVIKKIIIDDAAAGAAAVGGVHLYRIPQNSERPNVVLDLIGGSDSLTQQGPANFHDDRIRIACRGDTDEQAIVLARKVHDALHNGTAAEYGITVTRIFHIFRTGDYDDKADTYRQFDDYRIFYQT